MLSYLKRNAFGNSIVVGYLVPLIVSRIIILPVPRGADTSGYIFLLYLLPVIAIVSAAIAYFVFKSFHLSDEEIIASKYHEPFIEKIIILILGFLAIIFTFLAGYYSYGVGPVFLAIMSFLLIVLTRQWSFYKRVIWVIALSLIVVIILALKPSNF